MNQGSICFCAMKCWFRRGIDTIHKSSEQRGDGIAKILYGLSSIDLRIICRKNYTRQSSIKAVLQPSPKKQKPL